MAAQCTLTNRMKYLIGHQTPTMDFDTTTFKIGLLKAAIPAQAAIRDYNFVSDLTAACAEATAGGYARKASPGDFTLTVTEDDTNDAAYVTISADQVWTLASGDTIYGAFVMADRAGADTANELVSVIEFASGVATNGGTFTLQFPTTDGNVRTVVKIAAATGS